MATVYVLLPYAEIKSIMNLPPTNGLPTYRCISHKSVLFTIWRLPIWAVYIRVHPDSDGDDFIRRFRKDMREQLMIGNFYLEVSAL